MNNYFEPVGHLEISILVLHSSVNAKRSILSKLGSNLVWNDEKLSIFNSPAINKLVEGIKNAKVINPKFEPKNCVVDKGLNEKTSEISPVFSTMLALLRDFRTLDWAEEYKYPTVILSQMKQLLAEHQEG